MPEQESRRGQTVTVAPFEQPFENQITRFGVNGLNLKDSLDVMEGWSRLTNVDQEGEGEATGRQGQTTLATFAGGSTVHSIRKLRQPAVAGGGSGTPTIPDYSAIVAATLATFNPVIPQADEEAGKAQLTRAAAWAIYNGVPDTNIRLLQKTTGNQINNLSTDIILQFTDGSYADIASAVNNGNGTVTIVATWSARAGDGNTTDPSRWVTPTLALATAEPSPMEPI